MSEQRISYLKQEPTPCDCIERGSVRCGCDVAFIGNWAEAERRIQDGTLRGYDSRSIAEAVVEKHIVHERVSQ